MLFKNIPKNERPREKAIIKGIKSLSDVEIIALFLRTGVQKDSVIVVAQKMLEKIGGLQNLNKTTCKELLQIKGIGKSKGLQLTAILELVRRIKLLEETIKNPIIKKPQDVFNIMKHEFENIINEIFYVLALSKNNELIAKKQLYQGTKNQIMIDLRDIFYFVLMNNAYKIICIHNHPSGFSNPSKDDILTTDQIKNVAKKLNIVFVDHIIFCEKEFYSLILNKKFLV